MFFKNIDLFFASPIGWTSLRLNCTLKASSVYGNVLTETEAFRTSIVANTNKKNICFVASNAPAAQKALGEIVNVYGNCAKKDADVIVALGGDGLMLETLHSVMDAKTPVYGMNFGSIGFLMNDFGLDDLHDRLNNAEATEIHPLQMRAKNKDGEEFSALSVKRSVVATCVTPSGED